MSRTLFVGDVHGCSAELRSLLDRAAPDRVILVGDLFTRGPDPKGVWKLIRKCGAEAVLGNHDYWVLRRPRWWKRHLPIDAVSWLAERPPLLEGEGWLAVHAGLNPKAGPRHTSLRELLSIRRWPREDESCPFWWERYEGPPLVVYGHDAARGLVDRRPHTLGLDSGCVYGGRLTGWLLEEDRLIDVPAERAYRPVR